MYKIENFNVHIEQLDRDRMVRVYLPSAYDGNEEERYSVLYMHDGHNLFYKETSAFGGIWNIQKAMEKNEKSGRKGLIIVGIDCNNDTSDGRLNEYSPWVNNNLKDIVPTRAINYAGGEGEKYVDFIVKSLKPLIDKKYRTLSDKNNTFIAGSSMGGFISLYAGYKYNEVFSIIGAFSSAIWFKKDKLIKHITENFEVGKKVYLDIGTKETSDEKNLEFNDIYVNDTKEVYKLLLELGQPKEDIMLVIDEGANHSEASWERRFPIFLDWITK